jgi:hypothetical protein
MRGGYKEAEALLDGKIVILQPGQFVTSRRQMSINTGIQESKIERILSCFKTEQQIEQQNKSKYRIITITNWHKYQASEQVNEQQMNSKRTADEQQVNTDKEGKKERRKEKEPKTLSSSPDEAGEFYTTKKKRKLAGKRLEAFIQFWEAFSYRSGKAEAADAWMDIPHMTQGILSDILAAAKAEAATRPSRIAAGSTPKMAQGWLTARRWEDTLPDSIPTSHGAAYKPFEDLTG